LFFSKAAVEITLFTVRRINGGITKKHFRMEFRHADVSYQPVWQMFSGKAK
jgi:hypothetical protein